MKGIVTGTNKINLSTFKMNNVNEPIGSSKSRKSSSIHKISPIKEFTTNLNFKKYQNNSSGINSAIVNQSVTNSTFHQLPINLDLIKANGGNINIIVNNNFIKSNGFHENAKEKIIKSNLSFNHNEANNKINEVKINSKLKNKLDINSSIDKKEINKSKKIIDDFNNIHYKLLNNGFKPRTSSLIKNFKSNSIAASAYLNKTKLIKFQNMTAINKIDKNSNVTLRENKDGNKIKQNSKEKSFHKKNNSQIIQEEKSKELIPKLNNQTPKPTFIQSSYSELAKKLKQSKADPGKTSFRSNYTGNKIYFSSVNKVTDKKHKSYLSSDNEDITRIIETSNLNINNIENKSTTKKDEITKLVSFKNLTKSIKLAMPKTNRISYDYDKENFRNTKDSFMSERFKNIEGPEELHFTYVNLNKQKQKMFEHDLEDSDETNDLKDDRLFL